jgi:hypothetical protein
MVLVAVFFVLSVARVSSVTSLLGAVAYKKSCNRKTAIKFLKVIQKHDVKILSGISVTGISKSL